MPHMGVWEMVIVFLIVLIIFGPKALPKIGQALGKGIREFKEAARGLSGDSDEDRNASAPPPAREQLPPARVETSTSEGSIEGAGLKLP